MADLRVLRIAGLIGSLLAVEQPLNALAGPAVKEPAALSSIPSNVFRYAAFVAEASRCFAIPERWIRSVIQVERGSDEQATSSRGALGLMQIMPQTWVELSVRYDLGLDPFDPHDNILAGTAYLREMLDRFGLEGFLAAYNAGPHRYEEHLAAGRPLPEETQTYVVMLTSLFGMEHHRIGTSAVTRAVPRPPVSAFDEQRDSSSADSRFVSGAHLANSAKVSPNADVSVLAPHANGLFVSRSGEIQHQ